MSFFKRAIVFIMREKIRNILFFLLIFILGIFIIGTNVAQKGLDNLEKNIIDSLGGRVAIEHFQSDDENSEQDVMSVESLEEISKSSFVKGMEYNVYSTLESRRIQKVGTGTDVDSGVKANLAPQFLVQGVQMPETAEIQLNVNQLVGGRSFTIAEITNGDSVAMVSDALADKNGWEIGDTIVFDNNVYPIEVLASGKDSNEREEALPLMSTLVSVELIGFYTPPLREAFDDTLLEGKNEVIELENDKKRNTIFVPNKISEGINDYKSENSNQESSTELSNILFILESSKDLGTFIDENSPLLPQGYRFVSNVEVSNVVLESINMIKGLLTLVFYIALIGSLLIASFVIMLFLKNRKREIALYMALGEKKANIIGQFLVEISIIVTIALVCSFSLAGVFNNIVIDKIVFQQLTIQEEAEYEKMKNGESRVYANPLLSQRVTTTDAEVLYKVNIDYMLLIQTLVLGLLLIICTTGATTYVILRQDPKKMLESID